MNTENIKGPKRDCLFDNIEDAILKLLCYSASWLGGILVSKVQGTLLTSQGVFFLFFSSLGIEFILPAIRERRKKYFTWWSILFILILIGSIVVSFGAMYPALGPIFTPWLFYLSCIAMIFLLVDLFRHLHILVESGETDYEPQTPSQYEQSVASSYEKNGSEGFLTGGDKI